MTDDELRALERAAALGGPSRLKYARALERAGREDDAWRVKLAALDDPEVRREVARAPCWGQPGGGPGFTSYVDTPPLDREPRGRVVRRVGPLGRWFFASPLGLVWQTQRRGSLVLDGEGELRYPVAHGEHAIVMLAGQLVVVAEELRVSARDLWTGDPVEGALVLDDPLVGAGVDGDLLVLADRGRVTGFAWPASLARRDVRFETALPKSFRASQPGLPKPQVLLTATKVFVSTRVEHVVLDRSTGRVLFGGPGEAVQADAGGFVVQHEPAPRRSTVWGRWTLALHDAGGELRWSTTEPRHFALALARSFLAHGHYERAPGPGRPVEFAVTVVDRSTREVREVVRTSAYTSVAVARDVLYVVDYERGLTACSPDGKIRFRFAVPPSGSDVVPFRRGLYLLGWEAGEATLTLLEGP